MFDSNYWSENIDDRRKIKKYRRRIIFNDDGEELDREDAYSKEDFLRRRLKPLVRTHVDVIAYSVLEADAPVYASKVQPIYGKAHDETLGFWRKMASNLDLLIESGSCPLQIVVDFAHENNMECFGSVRMNDTHDSFIPGWLTSWKKHHPELLVDTKGILPGFELYTSSQDFVNKEVRQRKLEIIREVSNRYDIDGFELDFLRHPVFFSRTLRGEPCTDDEVDIMTSLASEIRMFTEEAADRRGRPLLISARVPDNFESSKRIGLDLETWLEKDLLDILVAGAYTPFSLPVKELVNKSSKYGVPVYPCINVGSINSLADKDFTECVRALASNWYKMGASGVQFFNLGTPIVQKKGKELLRTRDRFYSCLYEVGDPQLLVGKDKVYSVDNLSKKVFKYYAHISSRPPLPLTSKKEPIIQGVIQRVPIIIGENPKIQTYKKTVHAEITIKLTDLSWEKFLTLRFNGEELKEKKVLIPYQKGKECQLQYQINKNLLKTGKNYIEFSANYVDNIPKNPVEITKIKLKINHKTNK